MSFKSHGKIRLRSLATLLVLLLGAVLTGSVALAGLPTSGTQALPTQGNDPNAPLTQANVQVINLPKGVLTPAVAALPQPESSTTRFMNMT